MDRPRLWWWLYLLVYSFVCHTPCDSTPRLSAYAIWVKWSCAAVQQHWFEAVSWGPAATCLLACCPLQECFPYLARRLLADDDPRVRQALRDVLYGGKTRLDVDR